MLLEFTIRLQKGHYGFRPVIDAELPIDGREVELDRMDSDA